VSLLEQQGERDVGVIAKAAGIGNPKRIYVMRKQLKGRPPSRCLKLLGPAAGCGSRSQTGRPTRRCLPRWAVGVTRERLRRPPSKLASQ